MIRISQSNNWQPEYLRDEGYNPNQDEESMVEDDFEPEFGDGVPDGFKYSNHIHIQDDNVAGAQWKQY